MPRRYQPADVYEHILRWALDEMLKLHTENAGHSNRASRKSHRPKAGSRESQKTINQDNALQLRLFLRQMQRHFDRELELNLMDKKLRFSKNQKQSSQEVCGHCFVWCRAMPARPVALRHACVLCHSRPCRTVALTAPQEKGGLIAHAAPPVGWEGRVDIPPVAAGCWLLLRATAVCWLLLAGSLVYACRAILNHAVPPCHDGGMTWMVCRGVAWRGMHVMPHTMQRHMYS